ncbi:cytochrome P450 [Rhodobacteraceae bacterium Araon29]
MIDPPKPTSRQGKTSLWRYMLAFRKDILSAQPERLYRAWMAEFKTPFFRSYLINQPDLIRKVLKESPDDFPKSERISEGLRPLLGNSVFLTNGALWKRQRRIIDPAFEGGRLRQIFPAMKAASEATVKRIKPGIIEVEELASFAAADVIFRTLFSVPIEDKIANDIFREFQRYQRQQPILNIAAFVPLPRWVPRFHRRATKASARKIRALIQELTDKRSTEIKSGQAPEDLVTKLMTTPDPETGACFSRDEMVDQVAIFLLAGHETSASALAWALYLMALYPDWQQYLADEASVLDDSSGFSVVSQLQISRDVFRETLRLYPPVPMMVRQNAKPECFRDRKIAKGSAIVLSPWHLHRHQRLWENPDGFDPGRWQTGNGKTCLRDAFLPFSSGARVCPGAGFAMIEGPLFLSRILRSFRISCTEHAPPVPVAHLTVRAKSGIYLNFEARQTDT